MLRSVLLTVTLLATALAPASAHATTVTLDSHLVPHPKAGQILTATLSVSAASGERNDLTIRWDSDPSKPAEASLVFTDTTAPLHPGVGCVPAAGGGLACPLPTWAWLATKVDLGDGDDRLTVIGRLGIDADGGPGDDHLDATQAGGVKFSGGDGADVLLGSPGGDELVGGAGPDAISGGGGIDTVSYADHTTDVSIRLGGSTDDGALGEGDSIADDIEQAIGGAGNDVIVGTDGPNLLLGGSGDDRLEGLGGDDFVSGGSNNAKTPDLPAADVVLGGDGDDELSATGRGSLLDGGAGADRLTATGTVVVRPGPGTDHVLAQQRGAYIDTRETDGPARDLVRCAGGSAHLVLLGDDDFSTGCGRHVRQDHPRAIALLNLPDDNRYLRLGVLTAYCADVAGPHCAIRLSLRDDADGRILATERRTVQPSAGILLELPVPRKFIRSRDRIVHYAVSVRAPSGEVQTLRWRAWIPGRAAVPTDGSAGREDGGPLR